MHRSQHIEDWFHFECSELYIRDRPVCVFFKTHASTRASLHVCHRLPAVSRVEGARARGTSEEKKTNRTKRGTCISCGKKNRKWECDLGSWDFTAWGVEDVILVKLEGDRLRRADIVEANPLIFFFYRGDKSTLETISSSS